MLHPDELIRRFGLTPHPEGGHFRETFRDAAGGGARGASTAIYFLLRAGEESRWHRVDAAEVWHFYAGAPLELRTARGGGPVERRILGVDFAAGQRPQLVVEPHEWQAARSLGEFTLVGCTVAPAFVYERFELAPPGWEPG